MSEKHTPESWRVFDDDSDPLYITTIDESGGEYSGRVAKVYPGEHRDARARLIAAAPDLLAACESVADFMETIELENEGPWKTRQVKILRDAIAKATQP